MGEKRSYQVEVRATATGYVEVEAGSEEEAREMVEAGEEGIEISDVSELSDFVVVKVVAI